ncbi:hypothetical protein AwDysgo_06330 [Bacteroidales bacterium]|nr:hypothetical protein AwDysgo_06330 [Bacteroidales bacterium]
MNNVLGSISPIFLTSNMLGEILNRGIIAHYGIYFLILPWLMTLLTMVVALSLKSKSTLKKIMIAVSILLALFTLFVTWYYSTRYANIL